MSTVGGVDRSEQRRLAREQNEKLDFATGIEAERRFLKYRDNDPFPDVPPALLNSADIADYVSATGMIEPFHPDGLKTASYEVALLGRWFYMDEDGKRQEGVLEKDEVFELPPNSIAFMSVEPYFRLPDYIALRHNLKIDHIYKGLLVGTGPLIDPGFTGRIGLPLHNLTENTYQLKGGQGIIWVEFTKLSPSTAWAQASPPQTRRGAYTSFPVEKTAGKKVDEYVRDAVGLNNVPQSSSAVISTRSKKAHRVAKNTRTEVRRTQIWGSVAIAAIFIGLASILVGVIINEASLAREVQQLQDDVAHRATTAPVAPITTQPPIAPTPAQPQSVTPTP
ncbi:hypothetical protein ACFQ9V_09895 [Leifsonia sp. NPDC056665]|uniref:dCTP deaminase domain-containing protein n=1 Tax=Leifsonia sp. NPDC056665 TaxID=3345901 RepID=UPI0036B0408E